MAQKNGSRPPGRKGATVPDAGALPVERWPSGRVLITGATGLVGGRLAYWLRGAGVAVRATVRPGRSGDKVGALRRLGVEVVDADVTDADAIRAAMIDCQAVVHAAAATQRTPSGRASTWRVNADGPAIVYGAAREAGVDRFVHCSTVGVHGPLRRWPIDEDGPLRPDSVYRRSKLAGEVNLLEASGSRDGPCVVIARLTSVAGCGTERTWRSLRDSVMVGWVRLVGDGTQPIHVVDIDDACQGLVRCLTEPAASGSRYFIAGAEPAPLCEFMEAFADALGAPLRVSRWPAWPLSPASRGASRLAGRLGWEPAALHSLNFLTAPRAFRIDLARQDLGYTPAHDLTQTVRRTLGQADATGDATSGDRPGKGPAFSVVLIAVNGFDIIGRTVEHLRRQTIADRIELLIMSPDPAGVTVPEGVAESFHTLRVLDIGEERRVGVIRTEGIHRASAPYVAMSEDHSFANARWAEALLEQHEAGAAVVGPAMANANPETPQSWAAQIVAYAPWAADPPPNQGEARAVSFLPGHNSSYSRAAVLPFGAELDLLMSSEVVLHWALHVRGERIVFEPGAHCRHVNVTTLGTLCRGMYHHSRIFGALRVRDGSAFKRLAYIAASPLVPPLRVWRSWPAVRDQVPASISKARVMAVLTPALLVSAVGEVMGLAFGMGRSPYEDWSVELDRDKLIRPEDRHLVDADAPTDDAPATAQPVKPTNQPVRIGVIGCGKLVCEVHLPILTRMPGVTVAAIADPSDSARRHGSVMAPNAVAYADPADVLAEKRIDAIIIAAPTARHASLAIAAFEAGKHAYLEKPIADSLEDAERVTAAWRAAGTVGMIGFNYRQHPGYAVMRTAIANGRIGRVVHVHSVFATHGDAMAGGNGWRSRRDAGGGVLLDLFSHEADLIRYVLGQPITEVSARLNSRAAEHDTATIDAVTATGARVQGFYAFGAVEEAVLTVTGEDGQLSLDRYGGLRVAHRGGRAPGPLGRTLNVLMQWRGVGRLLHKRRSPWGEPSFSQSLDRFISAVRRGTLVRPNLDDGRHSLAVVAAAEAAARSGRAEPVADMSSHAPAEVTHRG